MTEKFAVVFPGQGSQSIGMLSELYDNHVIIKDTFDEASEALNVDLWKLIQQGPIEALNQTDNTQPAMLASGIAIWRLFNQSCSAVPLKLAGHSLGEYSALVASNALSFADALKCVAQRGRLMQEAVPEGEGAMAAILGLADEVVIRVCEQSSQGQIVEAVNFNSPGQVVIAGNKAAVDRAMSAAKEEGAKRALALPVSVPSHCALMKPAADKLADHLDTLAMSLPNLPVIHNVNVSQAHSIDEMKSLLKQQLYNPVKWVETVQDFYAEDIHLVIESGPGKVLTGLCKRINKAVNGMAIYDQASFDKVLERLNA